MFKPRFLLFTCSILLLLLLNNRSFAQVSIFPTTINYSFQKNFPLFYALQNAFKKEGITMRFTDKNIAYSLNRDSIVKTANPAALFTQFAWNDSTSMQLSLMVVKFLKEKKTFTPLVNNLLQSDAYIRFENSTADSFFMKAWQQDVKGINYILSAYTTNKGFRYAVIDAAAYDVNDKYYKSVLKELLLQLATDENSLPLFTPLHLALQLLNVNNRDEAGRHEPLIAENATTLDAIKGLKGAYPYSAILVLGEGPENNFAVSANSKLRCQRAAYLFKNNQAPVIIISGGYVHPAHTPYAEATELKQYMVQQLGIPANRILIEPHARHTTTNLRNTNRLMFAYNLPAHKPVLCTSGAAHIDYLVADRFATACIKIMGHIPYRGLKRVSLFEASFFPVPESLHRDSSDPLDP